MIFIFILVFLTSICSDAFAWGPGMHTYITLKSLSENLINSFSKIIEMYKIEFIWGSISADIIIGKNLANWLKHPHNWSLIFSLFDKAKKDNLKSFILGYMTHLSQDVIAHNFMIPEVSILLKTKIFSHIQIEMKAESLVKDDTWSIIRKICSSPQRKECDKFLEENIEGTILKSANTNRKIYMKIISNIPTINEKISKIINGDGSISPVFEKYISLAIKSSENFLEKFEKSDVIKADPTGIIPIKISQELLKIRSLEKKRGIKIPDEKFLSTLKIYQPEIRL